MRTETLWSLNIRIWIAFVKRRTFWLEGGHVFPPKNSKVEYTRKGNTVISHKFHLIISPISWPNYQDDPTIDSYRTVFDSPRRSCCKPTALLLDSTNTHTHTYTQTSVLLFLIDHRFPFAFWVAWFDRCWVLKSVESLKERSSKMASYGGTTQKCKACEKTVYLVDELTVDNKVYHRACFRCHHCKSTLKVFIFLLTSYFSKPWSQLRFNLFLLELCSNISFWFVSFIAYIN